MTTVLIPIAGNSPLFDTHTYPYPKPLIEIKGKTMIQRVIESFTELKEKKFVFIVDKKTSDLFHLDQILLLLTNHQCSIVKLSGETKGALCSALMAIDYITSDEELIITNGDQIINANFTEVVNYFNKDESDAGIITFESIHPKWSFVRCNKKGAVVEASEKRPISKMAIAGFYFFKKGEDFIINAKKSIVKDVHIGGQYYISSTLNELILAGGTISQYQVKESDYHSLYSPQKIKDYENYLSMS